MDRLKELIGRQFLKDSELLELEDYDLVIGCKYLKPYNTHYNEYIITIKKDNEVEEYSVYLKHR
ncbi:MAG: hypothetical protein ACRDA3_04780 [Peptostreptococcaceae bacterium]